ncbi:MAG: helix-turn-helix domain-containing protein [Acidobacteria bacterium]|nr:helix-turn-helix domain-containing protein [Acidobacteriota bacterium]
MGKDNSILESGHETAKDLHRLGFIDARRMSVFDGLCLDPDEEFGPGRVRNLRLSLQLSQAAFASLLNVSTSAVQKWEQGDKKPSSAVQPLAMGRNPYGIFRDAGIRQRFVIGIGKRAMCFMSGMWSRLQRIGLCMQLTWGYGGGLAIHLHPRLVLNGLAALLSGNPLQDSAKSCDESSVTYVNPFRQSQDPQPTFGVNICRLRPKIPNRCDKSRGS